MARIKKALEPIFEKTCDLIYRLASARINQKIDVFNQKAFINFSEKKSYKPIVISEDGLELIEFLSVDCTSADDEWHSNLECKRHIKL